MQVFNRSTIETVDSFRLLELTSEGAVYSGLSYDDAIVELHIHGECAFVDMFTTEEVLNLDGCTLLSAGIIAY